MNPFASYRAINTKLHAKRRILLSDAEWIKIAQCKNVGQIVEFLKKREGYKSLMTVYNTNDLHRSELEIVLDRYLVNEIEDMLHYFSGNYKEFFKTLLMEYEIHDLGLILRSITSNEDMTDIESLFVHSKKWERVNYQKLIACKNVLQFIEGLKGSSYYMALKTMTQEDLAKREFHMEMKLYMLFYSELTQKATRLNKKDEAIAKRLIGTKIDFLNTQWIYRALKYYDISPEEILIYSLPNGNRLDYRKLKTLSYAKDVETFKKLVEKYLSYPLFKDNCDAYLDCNTERYLYRLATRINKDDESIAASISYIYILGIEVNDLVSLTEGIRYAVPETELSRFLVHTI
ncbi:MAG: V-type ATPase subunit [Candidatus Cellulosilyticum pullistercoris]|uniref:V-type ATPase subunit n=1 Tax=Candidatus Cellulosilyticum pullistercoris TaxID=2838521 RepID=A0A9E2KC00_9FIRM|nr:V-type ATPase subunit [Candidatus Cellulosilyticum pullistercoris]